MSNSGSIIKKFSLGEEGVYYYIFNIHKYQLPSGNNVISTILLLSTNLMYVSKDIVNPYLQELITFLAELVVEHNASYDSYHNSLDPYSYEECEYIAEQVNAKAMEMRENGRYCPEQL